MNTEKFTTGLEYAPEFELFIPEENNPKRLYRARFELLGRPVVFPTKTNDFKKAFQRTTIHIGEAYLKATNPIFTDGRGAEDADDRAQDVYDRELSRAFGKVRVRSELELLQGILDAMVRERLKTYESREAFLKAKAYLDEKDSVEAKRRDEIKG